MIRSYVGMIGALSCILIAGCSDSTPKGAVLAFNLENCPKGWSDFKDGRGRVLIGANPSVPSTDGKTGENGLQVRRIGDPDGGSENVVIAASNLPPHRHDTINVETMQVQAHFQGYPALTVPGRDSNAAYKEQIASNGDFAAEPLNNMPPFVVLTYCQRD